MEIERQPTGDVICWVMAGLGAAFLMLIVYVCLV
jgi:hypothetical protein